MKEIERKFLVDLELLAKDAEIAKARPLEGVGMGIACKQGYIFSTEEKSLRVRRFGDKGYLTVKANDSGISRYEFEYEIPLADADFMLNTLCEGNTLFKIRYSIVRNGDTWEIDVFRGDNDGLVVAEIELESPDQDVVIPPWAVKEVTDDVRYLNVKLVRTPYKDW